MNDTGQMKKYSIELTHTQLVLLRAAMKTDHRRLQKEYFKQQKAWDFAKGTDNLKILEDVSYAAEFMKSVVNPVLANIRSTQPLFQNYKPCI